MTVLPARGPRGKESYAANGTLTTTQSPTAAVVAVARGPSWGFQLVQDLLVKSLGNVTASWGMLVHFARMQDAGVFRDEHSALAKAFVTSRMREVVAWSREVFGGNGILLDHDIARFFADAEAIYSFEGTREMNTLIVGKAITGRSAFV